MPVYLSPTIQRFSDRPYGGAWIYGDTAEEVASVLRRMGLRQPRVTSSAYQCFRVIHQRYIDRALALGIPRMPLEHYYDVYDRTRERETMIG